jgi:hypothetical protein
MKVVTFSQDHLGSPYVEYEMPEFKEEPEGPLTNYLWNFPRVTEIQLKFDDNSIYTIRRVG